ncbi:stage III sporulation protein AF [Natranaerofaba carboxydovora]|uniref:stage III sporulation protein AF n=1 Tax=Natranaerofaba carboxydovora TaxID=2742683 RepID=UPI001F143388|nr:stage III sporulation protein AF [Natranaerofaba carboxydovora]UMZ73958.1 Stage III sporulation protein AF (Spore_III_AF) [Natranaerofaba carboxydovora]
MLDMISELVGTIVIIIVLATFLDLLLPEGSIKNYVKLFIGLLIMLTILNPVVNLIDTEMAAKLDKGPDLFIETASPNETKEIIKRGDDIKESELDAISRRFESSLEDEISNLVGEYFDKYDLYSLKPSYNEEWDEDFGELHDLKLILTEKNKVDEKESTFSDISIEEVEDIKIKFENGDQNQMDKKSKAEEHESSGDFTYLPDVKEEEKNRLKNRLADEFHLSEKDINIRVKRR